MCDLLCTLLYKLYKSTTCLQQIAQVEFEYKWTEVSRLDISVRVVRRWRFCSTEKIAATLGPSKMRFGGRGAKMIQQTGIKQLFQGQTRCKARSTNDNLYSAYT